MENKTEKQLSISIDMESDVATKEKSDNSTKFSFHRHYRAILIVSIACLLAVNAGYTTGINSPAIRDFEVTKEKPKLNLEEITWFGSLVTLGAMLGSFMCGSIMDLIGRRLTMAFTLVIFVLGRIVISSAISSFPLLFGRAISGFAYGTTIAIVPVYLGEVAPAFMRGMLGTLINLYLAFGILIAFIFGTSFMWRNLAQIGIALASWSAILVFLIPESPLWLIKQKKYDTASMAFKTLSNETLSTKEIFHKIQELKISLQKTPGCIKMDDLLKQRFYKPVILVCVLNAAQQLSGVNAFMYYVHSIFHHINFEDENLSSILVGAIHLFSLIIAMMLMDRLGRRKLLLISCIGVVFCHISLGSCMFFISKCDSTPNPIAANTTTKIQLVPNNENRTDTFLPRKSKYQNIANETSGLLPSFEGNSKDMDSSAPHCASAAAWIALGSTLSFFVFFCLGLGPIPFIAISEMLPLEMKGFASGFATFINNLFSFLVIKLFPILTVALQAHGVFWAFAVVNFLVTIFVWIYMPETKGKSLIEIQRLFESPPNLSKKTNEDLIIYKNSNKMQLSAKLDQNVSSTLV